MSSKECWRTLRYYERIHPCVAFAPRYSPSGKYLLDYKMDFSMEYWPRDIVIVDLEAGYMKKYITLTERKELICCFYWLNDDEIVVMKQGGKKTEITDTLYYRIYALDHKRGLAELILKWEYKLPPMKDYLHWPIEISSNKIVIKNQVFAVVQVGIELVLLPWDVRRQNPSYAPIRMKIAMEEIQAYMIMGPGVSPNALSPCRYYAHGDSIYIELKSNEDDLFLQRTLMDRFVRINLSTIDLTCRCLVFNKDSPEVSVTWLNHISDGVEEWRMSDRTWSQGDYIVKIPRASHETIKVVVINLKDGTVFQEQLASEKEPKYSVFTIFNNKFLRLREFLEEDKYPCFQYNLMRSKYLPRLPNLRQICWEKVYLTDFYTKFVEQSPSVELYSLVFVETPRPHYIGSLFRKMRRRTKHNLETLACYLYFKFIHRRR